MRTSNNSYKLTLIKNRPKVFRKLKPITGNLRYTHRSSFQQYNEYVVCFISVFSKQSVLKLQNMALAIAKSNCSKQKVSCRSFKTSFHSNDSTRFTIGTVLFTQL